MMLILPAASCYPDHARYLGPFYLNLGLDQYLGLDQCLGLAVHILRKVQACCSMKTSWVTLSC